MFRSNKTVQQQSGLNNRSRKMIKKIMGELVTRFECQNCGNCKPAVHFRDLVCSSICDHQYRDGGFYITIPR